MQPIDTLASTVDSAWRTANYDEQVFPAMAAAALREARVPERVNADDILRELLTAESIPQQPDLAAGFAEPPLTVYSGRRFHLQVLFWLTGSTTVHDHGFCGAFQVLQGSSVQSRYAFHERRRISSRMLLGDLRLCGAELLKQGDVVQIDSDLIHSVFHLETPSVTLVVRTYDDPDKSPQYEYFAPSLAVDSFYTEAIVQRWLQALALLIRTEHRDYEALAADIIARTDLHTCYQVLDQAYRQLDDIKRTAPLVEAAARRHGEAASEIATVLYHKRFRRKLFLLRSDVSDPERRFFLALLQNLPGRDAIYEMVRQHYPDGDPRQRVVQWVHSLSGSERIGVDFDDDLNRVLFEALLDGCSGETLRERLKVEFDAAEVEAQAQALDQYAACMQQTVLAPLFRRGI